MNKIFLVKSVIVILTFTIPFWIWNFKYCLFEHYNFLKREEFLLNKFKSKKYTSQELDIFLAKKNKRTKVRDFFDKYMKLDRKHYLIKEKITNFFYGIYVIVSMLLGFFACLAIFCFVMNYIEDYLKLKDYPELVENCNAIIYPTPVDILEANKKVKEIKNSVFILDEEKEKIDEIFILEMCARSQKRIDEIIKS